VNRLGINGKTCHLSPIQKVEAVAWYKAKRQLGTVKDKAKEMGVPHYALQQHIDRMRRTGRL
jgi:hypothetical protein